MDKNAIILDTLNVVNLSTDVGNALSAYILAMIDKDITDALNLQYPVNT